MGTRVRRFFGAKKKLEGRQRQLHRFPFSSPGIATHRNRSFLDRAQPVATVWSTRSGYRQAQLRFFSLELAIFI